MDLSEGYRMSELLRVAFVGEGPRDKVVVECAFSSMLGERRFILRQLQPEESLPFGPIGTGWVGVYRWCRQAVARNDSAVKVLGDENLRFIARELLKTIRENVSIDWTAKESVRAKLRVMVKRVLRKHGYPPDKQEGATQTVIQQAEL